MKAAEDIDNPEETRALSDVAELIQEQERIARRSLEICAILRERYKIDLPSSGCRRASTGAQLVQSRPQTPLWPKRASNRELSQPLLSADADHIMQEQGRHRVFANKDAMKQELRERLADKEEPLREQDMYHKDGRTVVTIVKNKQFENLTFIVILLNMIWIGVDADYNHEEFLVNAPVIFQVVENSFCLYFTFELSVRFMSFRSKTDCLTDKGFMFDAFLVMFMVWDTWVMNLLYVMFDSGFQTPNTQALRILRLFRLMRVARMARLLRAVPEFMILVKGVGMALRSVFSTLCLLLLIMYVFAILFTELLAGDDAGKGCFDTVVMSMNCLMVNAVFADQATILDQVLAGGIFYYLFLVIFLVLTTMTVLNMLIGVMCELIGTTAEFERESIVVDQVRENVKKVLPTMDSDGDGMISEEEFVQILDSPEAMVILSEVDVDVFALVDFAEYIFRGRDQISFEDFMATIMKFRGGQDVTMRDLVDMREFLSNEIKELSKKVSKLN